MNQATMTLDYRAFKAPIGILAVVAGVAAASAAAMTASLFGALAASAVSAGAALCALFELAAPDRGRLWRAIAWAALVPSWTVFAAMLVQAPLTYADGLRLLATGLLSVGAALRIWRWHAKYGPTNPAVFLPALLALIELGIIWGGAWGQFGDTPVTAIGVAAALDLCGMGAFWLVEAATLSPMRPAAVGPTAAPVPIQLA